MRERCRISGRSEPDESIMAGLRGGYCENPCTGSTVEATIYDPRRFNHFKTSRNDTAIKRESELVDIKGYNIRESLEG